VHNGKSMFFFFSKRGLGKTRGFKAKPFVRIKRAMKRCSTGSLFFTKQSSLSNLASCVTTFHSIVNSTGHWKSQMASQFFR